MQQRWSSRDKMKEESRAYIDQRNPNANVTDSPHLDLEIDLSLLQSMYVAGHVTSQLTEVRWTSEE